MVSAPVPDSAVPQGAVPAQSALTKSQLAGVCLVGLILAFVLCRHFFTLPEDQFFANHDNDGYALRLIEFRDCLANGYMFPQWCSHFRGGLGSPFFNFYQSGYFYAASLVPSSLPVNWQLGIPLVIFAAYGFASLFSLLRRSCGNEPAVVAAVALLAAPYARTNLYLRGDLSEFSAMMCVPGCLAALNYWWNGAGIRGVLTIGLTTAPVVCLHPAIGLITCGMAALVVLAKSVLDRSLRSFVSGISGLATAAALSAVYWLPLFGHMKLVSADQAWDGSSFGGYYHYSRHLNPLRSFLDMSPTETPIPIKLGLPALAAVALTLILFLLHRKQADKPLRRHSVGLMAMLGLGLFLMTPSSLWLWDHMPLLNRIQFPWRILTLVSVTLAGLTGTGLAYFGSVPIRRFASAIMLVSLTLPLLTSRPPKLFPDKYPENASAIVDRYFAPDIANEWLPQGAKPFYKNEVALSPVVIEGGDDCHASEFVLGQNVMTFSVNASGPSVVRLPHYGFPQGWQAEARNRQGELQALNVKLDADSDGLMLVRIDEPLDGTVTVRWRTTQLKQIGAALSAAALLVTVLLLWRAQTAQAASKESGTPAQR
jgi:hypothetical protein